GAPHPQLESATLPLPLPLAREVEAAYQRFESAWQAGQRPLIEDYLSSLPELARPVLFPELLELELSFRRRAGEIVRLEEYRQRFPAHVALVGSFFPEQAGEVARSAAGSALATRPERACGDSSALTPYLC